MVVSAEDRQLGVPPAPNTVEVASTTWVSLPEFVTSSQMLESSAMGVVMPAVCSAVVVVKDSAIDRLKTRVLFNGKAGQWSSVTNLPDGTQQRVYSITSPPNGPVAHRCTVQLQVAKASGSNIELRAVPAPPEEDILSLAGMEYSQ